MPPICDFCSTPNPTRTFYCVPFLMYSMGGVDHISDNAWAACEQCAKLVDGDCWEELARRSVSRFPVLLSAGERKQYIGMLLMMYQRFRVAMTGQTQPH